MGPTTKNTYLAFLFVMMAAPAGAATLDPQQTPLPVLSLTPSQTTVNVGDTFTVEVIVTGLADGGIAGLSAFDTNFGYIPELFSYDGYTLGTMLGNPDLGESVDTSEGLYLPWAFNVGQTSNLSADYLSMQIPDSFVLVALEFTALAATPECSCIVIGVGSQLYDGFGDLFLNSVINEGVMVTVVPVPAAVWMFLAALAVVPRSRRFTS